MYFRCGWASVMYAAAILAQICAQVWHFWRPFTHNYGSSWPNGANHWSITIVALLMGSIWRNPRGTAAMDGALWSMQQPFWLRSVLKFAIFSSRFTHNYGSLWPNDANHSPITIAALLMGSIWKMPRGTAAMDGALWCMQQPFWLRSVWGGNK